VDAGPDLVTLVAAAQGGDHQAWDEIVDRFTPLLVGVLRRYRLNHTELQDVAQTVWLRVIEHLGRLLEPRALPAWIITTAKREALRVIELSRRVDLQDPQDDVWASWLVTDDHPDDELERSERRAALLEGFAALTLRQRQVLLLLCQDPPLPYTEVSRRIGLPIGAIGPTRARALERLRREPCVQALMAGFVIGPSRGEGHE
jgi:RNA polymerase sigma factor (sigma-70 family)